MPETIPAIGKVFTNEDGTWIVIERHVSPKRVAQRIASTVRGHVVDDGPRRFAVLKSFAVNNPRLPRNTIPHSDQKRQLELRYD